MDEDECGRLLLSHREHSSLGLGVRTATSKAEAREILQAYELSEEDLAKGFPCLFKVFGDLPDESPPAS
ncbi:hypothetical protein ACFYV5_21845 [Streptomyces sp. NPDC003035]|uniref:hypothetical protein n=1 Tax=Streptomyces sp. NPDC003035 TaxID=3364676 RepID=UPI003681C6F7